MDAAVAALLGAALGAVGSVGGVWLSQRHQTRRDLLRAAVDLGRADHEETLELLRREGVGGLVPPMSLSVAYHAEVLMAIADKKFDPAAIARIEEEMLQLMKALPRRGLAKEVDQVASPAAASE